MKETWSFTPEKFRFMLRFLACLMFIPCHAAIVAQADPPVESSKYRTIFGEHYREAEEYFLREAWIADSLQAHGIPAEFGIAVTFPEVIRYSAIRDALEMQGLFSLYVQYGQKYANFSVGRFQMKPSFAEQVEKDAAMLQGGYRLPLRLIDFTDTPGARLNRAKRLSSPEWQLIYLMWYIEIMDSRYGLLFQPNDPEKLKFYAAAYNCGYSKPESFIRQKMKECHFHTAVFSAARLYNYAEIAGEYYLSIK
jgi:hypothetical protein